MTTSSTDDIHQLLGEQLQMVLALDAPPSPDARLAEDLHADSLDLVEVVERVQQALAAAGRTAVLRDDVVRTIRTVDDAAEAIRQAVGSPTTTRSGGRGGAA